MSAFHDNMLLGASGANGGHKIERSLRFNSADVPYLSRGGGTSTNRKIRTFSFWTKFAVDAGTRVIASAGSGSNREWFGINGYNFLYETIVSGITNNLISTQVFRDASAWYHFVIAIDTTQTTGSNRIKIYTNGTQISSFSTANYPAQNADLFFNDTNGSTSYLGVLSDSVTSTYSYNGLIAEFHFIDGQALTPSSFGEINPVTGVWQPKKYTGTYGTNGFYLNFSDDSGTTSTTLGKDSSGNGNNWTPNNFSVTAGAGNDSLIDTPTPYADGGNGRGNYCTWNPISGSTGVVSNGNLDTSNAGTYRIYGTLGLASGKWYWEHAIASIGSGAVIGISSNPSQAASDANRQGYYSVDGRSYNDSGNSAYGNTYTTGDVIGVAYDADTGKLYFSKNGTWQNSGNPATGANPAVSGLTGTYWPFATIVSCALNSNFGQRPFAYTPPAGFLALNTQNLPEPSIKKPSSYMDVALDTGANILAAAQSKLTTGADLIWIKDRANGNNHQLIDTVRGGTLTLQSNTTGQETTYSAPSGSSVAWCWDKGATPGFDIVTYTGNGTNRTIAHSLGVAPSMLFIKKRTGTTGYTFSDWVVWHTSIPATNILLLSQTWASTTETTVFNSTAPTSSVFSLGTNTLSNENTGTFVAYLWSEVAGFSKFGSYTGNGSSDGPFVCCGFRPRWVMIKRSNSTGSWYIYDTARETYNLMTNELCANLANAENPTVNTDIDVLSSGLKLRGGDGDVNYSGHTYIFAAFAESPFKHSLAR